MIKAVFFDFDGVLTLDATGTTSIVNYVTAKTGIDKESFNREYRKFNRDLLSGRTTHDLIWGDLCRAVNREISIKVLMDSYIHTPLDFQMIALARGIKSQGYRLGIITDNKADRIETISAKHRLDKLFDVISVSASVGSTKSGKEIFRDAMGKAGARAEECIFIDNNPRNLLIPEELGMSVIYFDHDKRDYDGLINQLHDGGVRVDS